MWTPFRLDLVYAIAPRTCDMVNKQWTSWRKGGARPPHDRIHVIDDPEVADNHPTMSYPILAENDHEKAPIGVDTL